MYSQRFVLFFFFFTCEADYVKPIDHDHRGDTFRVAARHAHQSVTASCTCISKVTAALAAAGVPWQAISRSHTHAHAHTHLIRAVANQATHDVSRRQRRVRRRSLLLLLLNGLASCRQQTNEGRLTSRSLQQQETINVAHQLVCHRNKIQELVDANIIDARAHRNR